MYNRKSIADTNLIFQAQRDGPYILTRNWKFRYIKDTNCGKDVFAHSFLAYIRKISRSGLKKFHLNIKIYQKIKNWCLLRVFKLMFSMG